MIPWRLKLAAICHWLCQKLFVIELILIQQQEKFRD